MKDHILSKLRRRGGESIAETLIALLISSLALVMLAGAISTASKIVTTNKKVMTEYYQNENVMAMRNVSDSKGATVKLVENDGREDSDKITLPDSYDVNYYVNSGVGGKSVIAYAQP